MIIATIITYFVLLHGGGASYKDAVAPEVKKAITNQAQQKQVLAVVDDIDHSFKEYGKSLKKYAKEFGTVNADRTSTREQYDALLSQIDDLDNQNWKKYIELRAKLKALMSRDEWRAVFAK